MTRKEQIERLLRSVEEWNQYRVDNVEFEPDLRFSDLRGANITRADLTRADLTRADLRGADLKGADLTRADLKGADLTRADLKGADLRGADLRGAYLTDADLEGADLKGADFKGTTFRGADLTDADIDFSCLPLWCGGLGGRVCEKNAKLIGFFGLHYALQHFKGGTLHELIEWVNTHHRASETGKIEWEGKK